MPSTLTVDGSQHFQTIDGFGTNLSSEAWNSGAVTPSLDTLLAHGYKLFRVIVEPVQGWEDTNPNTGQFSNSNPNWAYYNNLYGTSTKFTNLWNTIRYLNDHGATVWVNLQSDAPAWMTDSSGAPGSVGSDHEADWATMVSTMVDYAVNTAHVRIDGLGPMNEPDNSGDPVQGPQVDAAQYVRMLDTLETQLQGYGLGTIPLVGPDTASPGNAVDSYVPAMLSDPFLMPHVLQFGFHTYGLTVSDSAITSNSTYPGRHIVSDEYDAPYYNEDHGQRATPAQLWTQADVSFQDLIGIVNAGENGAIIWDGVDNYYEYYQQWSAHGLISYDWTAADPTAQADYGTTPRLYTNAMMFQFVAPGSIRIGSSDDAANFIEAAFQDPATGRVTVVGENIGTSSQTFAGNLAGGLNTSLFNLYYTNSSLSEQRQADVAVTGNAFTFSVPADTIFTLTTPAASAVTGVTPISGLTTGGQAVTITGSGFTGATSVSFGGVAAGSFTVNSDTQITAVTPAHAAGTVDVTVAGPGGSSALTAADRFLFVAPNGTGGPTVTTAASATLAANGTSAALTVQGASQYGADTLTYTWTTLGSPPAPVTFSTNGNNGANNVTATFAAVGTYNFGVTITDPAGNTATSNVSVTVNQVATTLTVSPSNGAVPPNGTLQFTDTATDQFANPYTATPISWTVSGGGAIDNTGLFTAGGATGGPFTVTASVGGKSATASVTISSNVNLGPNGTAYRWFGMSSATANTNQTAAPGLNDNNLTNDVPLTGGSDDVANAYEAAGVVWSSVQTINKVAFTNGSFNTASYDGVFDNNFGLQVTTDGTTWTAVSGWSVSPAYPLNQPGAAGQTYTFTGPALTVRGVRVVGQVHSLSGNDSWLDNASEVQAYGGTTVVVTTLLDTSNPSGSTSLRQAIAAVNAGTANTIDFNINGGGAQTITLTSALPAITASSVFINGLSQGGSGNTTPLITIDGSGAGTGADGLKLTGTSCTVSGLIIESFSGNGIEVDGANNTIGGTAPGAGNIISGNTGDGILIDSGVSGTQVQGNSIGTNAAGTTAVSNSIGVEVAGNNNTIGGASGSGNLISGNSSDGVKIDSGSSGNVVLGNAIGVNTYDNAVLGNSVGIEVAGHNNTLGASYAVAPNVISGNSSAGVLLDSGSSANQVLGNYIGTNAGGTIAMANKVGVEDGGISNTIGGSLLGSRNIISGNTNDGVLLDSGEKSGTIQGNYIGLNLGGNTALANSGNGVEVKGTGNIIGGNSGSNVYTRNYISGNGKDGVLLDSGASGNQVLGNFIGIGVSGTNGVGNTVNAIEIASNSNTIGGSVSGTGNIISASGNDGVLIDSTANNNLLQGNYVGTDYTGTSAVANSGSGIKIQGAGNTVGAGNLISGNSKDGVRIDSSASGTQVLGNTIGLNFSSAALANGANGINIASNNNTIGGTASGARNVISGNSNDGIFIASGSSGNQVQGNYLGTNVNGTSAVANSIGIEIAGNSNTIGGSVTAARNVISGNSGDGVKIDNGASGNLVEGDAIGVNTFANAVLGNSGNGIEVAGNNNTLGASYAVAPNQISGNSGAGVMLDSVSSANQVLGSYIGTNANGTAAMANKVGVEDAGTSNTIGGSVLGSRNIISGNTGDGVLLDSSVKSGTIQGNYIGVDLSGNTALANTANGVEVKGTGNTIGGNLSTSVFVRNYISGNGNDGVLFGSSASGNQVLGNFIGIGLSGANGVGNLGNGVEDGGSSNTIGSVLGARNYISANSGDGVLIDSTATAESLLSNFIGLNANGNAALANSGNGVEIKGTANIIGGNSGSNAYTRNYISGNGKDGLLMDSGASGNQVLGNFIGIAVSGTQGAGNLANGIEIAGSSNTIGGTISGTGNIISASGNDGVLIDSTGASNLIQGNYVGTDYTGTSALANSGSGIEIQGAGNTVGAGNIISGNSKDGVRIDSSASGTQVLGNTIGLNLSSSALANGANGLNIASNNNTIGGTATAARNVISGNSGDGILIASGASGNQVQGNYLGTNVNGTSAAGNLIGIEIAGNSNTVGGSVSGARNLISGNRDDGVKIDSGASGNLVEGNAIGINAYANAVLSNSGNGIEVAGNNNTLGASYAVAPNQISGNSGAGVKLDSGSSANQVLGSYIGTNANGTAAIANKVGVEDAGSSNTIGGTVLGSRNIISGNTNDGVLIDSSAKSETLQGNYIGVDLSGNTALANGSNGVEVKGTGNTIGGNLSTSALVRNYISGNRGDGVLFDSTASSNQVLGNFIGIGLSGTTGVGNLINGVEVGGSSNTVGGTVSGYKNIISANGNDGVLLDSTGTNNLIQGNDVGTDYTGQNPIGNRGNGIEIAGSSNILGGAASAAGNIISGNSKDGVLVSAGFSNTIRQNSIFANAGLGISLASGANNGLAAPTLSSATLSGSTLRVQGSFAAATANVSYVLEFFANPSGDAQGKIYLGSLTVTPTTTGMQAFTFTATTTVTGTYPLITATLTDGSGDTSLFSNGVTTS